MDIVQASAVINTLSAAFFCLLVVFQGKQKQIHFSFYIFLLAIAGWATGLWFWLDASTVEQASFWIRFLSVFSFFVPAAYFHWIITSYRPGRLHKIFTWAVYGIAAMLSSLMGGSLVVGSLSEKLGFPYWPDAGPLYAVYVFVLLGLVLGYSAYILISHALQAKARDEKGKTWYIVIASLIGFLGAGSAIPLWYDIPLMPYGVGLVSAFPFLWGYSLVKYRLFSGRAVFTEVFVFFLILILSYRAVLSDTLVDYFINGVVALATILVGVLLLRSVYQEVNQRKQLEELSERLKEVNEELQKLDQMKTEFLSLASHQLRTPLTSIKGYASMVLEGSFGELTKKVREPVRRIFESSNILTKIIADLLDVSKIEQGGLQYEMLTFSLASMLQSVVDEQSINAKEKKIHLSLDLKQPGKYALKGDQVKLRQVFQNLIDNAIKYTDEGGTVTVELSKKQSGDQKSIRVAVVDNGRGIEPEMLKKLFQKFSRGTAGKKTNTGGSGLGLYLAKQIAKAHAGDLWAESDGPNKGSSFIAEFPQQY